MGIQQLPLEDWKPPTEKPERPEHLPTLIDLLKPTEKQEKQAEQFAKLVGADGKFTDAAKAGEMLREAYYGGHFRLMEHLINKQLEKNGSASRIKFDDSMAHVQDIGGVAVYIKDAKTGKETDNCGFPIDNSPRLPLPFDRHPSPLIENPRQNELPPDWPRLDIIDPSPRNRGR
jgi:hypothetical protein